MNKKILQQKETCIRFTKTLTRYLLAMLFMLFAIGTQAQWSNVGNAGFSADQASWTSLAFEGSTPYVAFRDAATSNKATVMKYNGVGWVTVGNAGFSSSTVTNTSLAFDGSTPYVGFTDGGSGNKATVMKFNGISWVTVGSAGFSAAFADYLSLELDGSTPYVAYRDGSNLKATVKKFDGTNWVTVGNAGFSASQAIFTSLAFDGSTPYVAFREASINKATVMKFNGTSWVNVGSPGFSAGDAEYTSLAFNGSTPYVAYKDVANNNKATVMKFNGSSWVTVGSAGFSAGSADYTTLAFNGSTPYVAYKDYGNNLKATVMKYNGSSWVNEGNAGFSAGSTTYNSIVINGSNAYVAYSDGGNSNKTTVMKSLICNSTSSSISQSICQGSSYTFNGIPRTTAGAYSYTLVNAAGCDSIITLNLTVMNPQSTINQNICQGSSYTFNGIARTSTGVYLDTLVSALGCDSIVTLNLSVLNPNSSINQSICQGGSFTFNGIAQTTAGIYLDTLVSALGCDSIVTLNLTVTPTPTAIISSINPTRCGLNGTIALSSYSEYTLLATNTFSGSLVSPFSTTGSATINNGEMQLTSATNSQNGAFIYTPTSTPGGFTALFDMNIYSAQASGNNVADGMSFNYGVLSTSPTGDFEDGILNGNGLVIRFKEWQTQRVQVLYNGVLKGTYEVDVHNPTIRKVRVAVLPNGKLDLSIGNQILVTNLDLGIAYTTDNKSTWKFAWAARTGGSNNRHAIDNIEIYNNNGIRFTNDNWTSSRALPFFNVVPNAYTIQGDNATCSSTIGTATVAAFNASNFTTVSNVNNPTCTGRTITVTNTLVNDTLVWSDFASRPTLSNFGNLGSTTFSNGIAELTPAINGQNGKLVFPISPNAGVFTANFNMRIWDGGGADGMSFNYGVIDNIDGGDGGMCNTMGLSICMPTWSGNGGQRLIIKYKGVQIGSTISSVAIRNSNYIPVTVTVNPSFKLSVTINGTVYLNNYDLFANTTYASDTKSNWQFAFGARTGGTNDAHRIDDVIITGKPGLLYSYDGGTTFETTTSKTMSNTNAVTVVVKADGTCNSSTVSFPAINTTPTFNQVLPICAGATLAALPTTSLNGVTGSWSPSINNVVTTMYTFTPSSNCNPTTSMTIVVNPIPSIMSVLATPNTICAGEMSTLKITAPQSGIFVSTLAGSGAIGSVDGIGTLASFKSPNGVAIDNAGNVYVADYLNNKIRKITSAGVVTTFAGSNTGGSADGIGTAASFVQPTGVAIDISGNVFIVDQGNHKIRKATPSGVVTTFAGSGTPGFSDGPGVTAMFDSPSGIAVDNAGNVYVADQYNNMIRKITAAGVVSTLAGTGSYGSTDGPGTSASFNFPTGVAIDNAGNVYVADKVSNKIRKITAAGFVSTLAGTGLVGSVDGVGTSASFYYPNGVAVDNAGNVYVADQYNKKIRKVTAAGIVSTIAGTGLQGNADGAGASASFNYPSGVALDNAGNVYVADQHNNKIRKISQTEPQTYIWSGTVNSLSAALDTVSVMPTASTIYTVTASTASGCTTTSTVQVTVKPNFSITASAGVNGSISPSGNSAVCEGNNKTYTITPNANYQIADILVDGISVGAVSSYTFSNVTAPHTISASFVLICVPTSNTTNATACYTYTWSVNNVTYNTSGTYTSVTGCHTDSLILIIEACKDVKCFLQGYYTGSGNMQPVLMNQGVSAPATACDTIDVSLHSTVSPYVEVYSFKGVLSTTGLISCVYPEAAIGNSYYLVVQHRNSIELWSADPILMSSNMVYDFTTAANKAVGSNQLEVEPGIFAMYTGDLNRDGFVDPFDFPILDADIFNGIANVYALTDLNGDGFADSFDFPIFDLSSTNGISILTP